MTKSDVEHALRQRLVADGPVEERSIDVDGTATTVLEGGSGPPLVLIHGGSQAGALNWLPVLPELTEHYRVIAPDLPGLGESAPLDTLSAATFGSWLQSLVNTTCDQPPTLLAHSLPAGLTARFVADRTTPLQQLILVGAPALSRHRPPPALLLAAIRLNLRPTRANLDRFARWPYHDLERVRQQDSDQFQATSTYLLSRAAIPHIKRTMRQFVKHGATPLSDEQLQRLPPTTSLIWGRHDRMAPLTAAKHASKRFGWPLHIVDDAGHLPFVEQPRSFLAALNNVGRAST